MKVGGIFSSEKTFACKDGGEKGQKATNLMQEEYPPSVPL